MGSEDGFPQEAPVHPVCIESPFWIDITEVTNDDYVEFLNDQADLDGSLSNWIALWDEGYEEISFQAGLFIPAQGLGRRPVYSVTWYGADAYCRWRESHLPSEAEWEFAARGPNSLVYPWGNELLEDNVVIIHQYVPDIHIPQVGSKPGGASWVGVMDMSSNLFEWTSSIYQAYPYDPKDGREVDIDQDNSSQRVLRSGSWYHTVGGHIKDNITTSARYRNYPDKAHWSYGFRCARSLDNFIEDTGMLPYSTPPTSAGEAVHPTTEDCETADVPAIACTGVSTNDEWAPIIREFSGVEMVLVPAGCFLMGSSDEQIEYALNEFLNKRSWYESEQPVHQRCFSRPFWIDLKEVSTGQYGLSGWMSGDDLPRETITWFEAVNHCESRGVRLPTEAEWEYAARGPDNLIFPWGNTFDGSLVNFCDANCPFDHRDEQADDGFADLSPVGSYPGGASWVGALDMSGNVWEWTNTIYAPYPYNLTDGREAEGCTPIQSDNSSPDQEKSICMNNTTRVLRGG